MLTDLSAEIAAVGGDRDRTRLLTDLTANRSTWQATGGTDVREGMAEASALALADMDDQVGGTVLARTERVERSMRRAIWGAIWKFAATPASANQAS